jgi:hypothetical protein
MLSGKNGRTGLWMDILSLFQKIESNHNLPKINKLNFTRQLPVAVFLQTGIFFALNTENKGSVVLLITG